MQTAKYLEVEASYKNCHTDIYFKTKNVVASGVFKGRRAKHLPRTPFLGVPLEVLCA